MVQSEPSILETIKKLISEEDFEEAESLLNLLMLKENKKRTIQQLEILAIKSFSAYKQKNLEATLEIAQNLYNEKIDLTEFNNENKDIIIMWLVRAYYRSAILTSENENIYLSCFYYYQAIKVLQTIPNKDINTLNILEANYITILDQIKQDVKYISK